MAVELVFIFAEESERIQQCGGKVICKSGVPRVVWNRPKMGHKGPVRRSTHIDEIPFLAVARSLGDLWSYNSEENVFVVSPEPDIRVYPVDISKHRCLILGTDGAWNMLTPQNAISTVCQAEKANEAHMLNPVEGKTSWINPSKQLVDTAIERWNASKLRADNTSVVTVMLDPPGPPRAQVLKNRKRELAALNAGRDLPNPNQPPGDRGSMALVTNTTPEEDLSSSSSQERSAVAAAPAATPRLGENVAMPAPPPPAGSAVLKPGCSIISRFPNSLHPVQSSGFDLVKQKQQAAAASAVVVGGGGGPPPAFDYPHQQPSVLSQPASSPFSGATGRLSDSTLVNRGGPAPAPSSAMLSRSVSSSSSSSSMDSDSTVQCNEISSSEDTSPRAGGVSERESSPTLVSTSPEQISSLPSSSKAAMKTTAGVSEKGRKSLSRELSALRLTKTPAASTLRSMSRVSSGRVRRTRVEASSASSDTENLDSPVLRRSKTLRPTASGGGEKPLVVSAARLQSEQFQSTSSVSDVEQRCRDLHAKLESMEQKSAASPAAVSGKAGRTAPLRQQQQQHQHTRSTSKTLSTASFVRKNNSSAAVLPASPTSPPTSHHLRSADSPLATPLRSLRSRPGATPATGKTVASGTKRRRPLSESGSVPVAAAKSPRTVVVSQKPPVVNRSRQARVLRLKK